MGRPSGVGAGPIQAASVCALRQLVLLRNIAIVGQTLTLIVVDVGLGIPLPTATLFSVTGFLVLLNLATYWRLQCSWPVTDLEVAGQIAVDVDALTLLLYFSGGATNPFVGLLLLPVVIAAASLPRSYAWSITLFTIACYSLLALFQFPLPGSRNGVQDPQLPLLGTWLTYVVSAGLIAYLVLAVTSRLSKRNRSFATAAQRDLNREYLVRVGSLAAGAVHEIRSPLCTMAVLVNEMLLRRHDDSRDVSQLRVMHDQIEACRRTLSDLVTYGQDVVVNGGRSETVDRLLHEVVDRWRMLRPGVKLACRWAGTRPPPKISTECGLGHAILNLLNNAADVSPEAVEMNCRWNPSNVKILILDRGPGISSELDGVLGERFLTTKRTRGTGIGLLLAKAAIQRAGGRLRFSNRSGGGVRADVVLPLSQPQARVTQIRRRPHRLENEPKFPG